MLVGLGLLLTACGADNTGASDDPISDQELCVRSVQNWLDRELGDGDAYSRRTENAIVVRCEDLLDTL